jgi:hypothetical protein
MATEARLGSNTRKTSYRERKRKTDLTLSGLLMEGVSRDWLLIGRLQANGFL